MSGRADLLSRAAKLYAGRLNNRRAAIDAWKLVLNLDQNNLATAAPAAAALEALYADTSDVANLVKTLRLQARWADGAAARKKILFRIAGLEEKSLGDTEAAVATLRAILEIDPQDHTAIDALDRIFEAGANHRQRVEILRKRIDLAGDASARQELWRSVASLLENDVGDVDEAIAACVSILDENPEDDQALETLARLYEQQGRHRDRLEIVERRLALRKPKDADRLAAPAADCQAAGGAARRSDRRARALARGAGTGAGRSRGAGGAGAFPGARHRRRPAAGGRAGAGADLREGRPLRRAGRRSSASTSRRRPTAARAWRADAAGGARGDAPDDTEAALRDHGAGDPRRADRARAARAARRLRAPGRPGAPGRGDGVLPRHQPGRARRGAQAAPRSHHRRGGGGHGRRDDWRPTTTAGSSIASPTTTRRWPRSTRSTAATATTQALYEILLRRAELARIPPSKGRCGSRSASWPRPSSSGSTTPSPPTSGSSRSRPPTARPRRRSIASTRRPSAGAT